MREPLKQELHLNVELASPSDFLPPLEHWKERSRLIGRFGMLQVFHYDFVSQALSKIERGHWKDLQDVEEMFRRGLVTEVELRNHSEAIRPRLIRYPAIDESAFLEQVKEFLERRRHV